MQASYLANPSEPQMLLDALHYRKVGLLYLGSDGNYRWNTNKGLKRWMRPGRIATPFNMALKKGIPNAPESWHDKAERERQERIGTIWQLPTQDRRVDEQHNSVAPVGS